MPRRFYDSEEEARREMEAFFKYYSTRRETSAQYELYAGFNPSVWFNDPWPIPTPGMEKVGNE